MALGLARSRSLSGLMLTVYYCVLLCTTVYYYLGPERNFASRHDMVKGSCTVETTSKEEHEDWVLSIIWGDYCISYGAVHFNGRSLTIGCPLQYSYTSNVKFAAYV